AVVVEVAGRHIHAAGETGDKGEEAGQKGAAGDLAIGLHLAQLAAVDDLDVRAGARAGADHEVGVAVAVDVGHGHADAAAEDRGEGVEAGQKGAVPAAEDLDVAAGPSGPGAGDDVGEAVAIDVARRHAHAAAEQVVRRQVEAQRAVGIVDEHGRGGAGAGADRDEADGADLEGLRELVADLAEHAVLVLVHADV